MPRTTHPFCCYPRCECFTECIVDRTAKQERVAGIIVGLEMAEEFMLLTKRMDELASMIKAAKLSADDRT